MENKRASSGDRRKKPRAAPGRRGNEPGPAKLSKRQQASHVVNSLVVGVIGVGFVMVITRQFAKRSGIEIDVDQSARLLFMTFGFFALTTYFLQTTVARFVVERRNERAAAARKARPEVQLPRNWGDVLEQRLLAFDPVLETKGKEQEKEQLDRYVNRPDGGDTPFEERVAASTQPFWQPPIAGADDEVSTYGTELAAASASAPVVIPGYDPILDAFVAGAQEAGESADNVVDPVAMFGVQLYVAGACVECARQKGWTSEDTKAAIVRALKKMDVHDRLALSLAQHVDEFASVPEFRALIDSGRTAMTSFVDDAIDQTSVLTDVLTAWRLKAQGITLPDLQALLMTKLTIGSVSGQTVTSDDRSRVAHGHRAIVNEACSRFGGQVVTTTQGGVAAAFVDPDRAMRAAVSIQEHSEQWAAGRSNLVISVHVSLDWDLASTVNDKFISLGIPRGIEILNLVPPGAVYCTQAFREQVADAQTIEPLFFPELQVALPPLFAVPRAQTMPVESAPIVEYRHIGSQPKIADPVSEGVSDLDKWLADNAKAGS